MEGGQKNKPFVCTLTFFLNSLNFPFVLINDDLNKSFDFTQSFHCARKCKAVIFNKLWTLHSSRQTTYSLRNQDYSLPLLFLRTNTPCTENLQQKVQKAHPKKGSRGRHNFAEPAHLLYENNRYIQEPDRIDCPLLRTPFFRHCVTPTYYMLQEKKGVEMGPMQEKTPKNSKIALQCI